MHKFLLVIAKQVAHALEGQEREGVLGEFFLQHLHPGWMDWARCQLPVLYPAMGRASVRCPVRDNGYTTLLVLFCGVVIVCQDYGLRLFYGWMETFVYILERVCVDWCMS